MSVLATIFGGAATEGVKTAAITEGTRATVITPEIVYGNLESTMAMPNLEVSNLDKVEATKISAETVNVELVERYKKENHIS